MTEEPGIQPFESEEIPAFAGMTEESGIQPFESEEIPAFAGIVDVHNFDDKIRLKKRLLKGLKKSKRRQKMNGKKGVFR